MREATEGNSTDEVREDEETREAGVLEASTQKPRQGPWGSHPGGKQDRVGPL